MNTQEPSNGRKSLPETAENGLQSLNELAPIVFGAPAFQPLTGASDLAQPNLAVRDGLRVVLLNEQKTFYLLTPENLPRSRAECSAGGDAAAALDIMSACALNCPDESALAAARKALVRLNLGPQSLQPVGEDLNESEDNRSNDKAFGIVRVRGEVIPLLINSTLQGFVALLEEAIAGGANVTAEEWTQIRNAFSLLFYMLEGRSFDEFARQDSMGALIQPPRAAEEQHSALSRWVRGHHLFMVMIQGLVAAFGSFQHEVEAGRFGQAKNSLRAATLLMVGSGVALRFTGDFQYSDYERIVRPTLQPPVVPEGLTGLYWRDHEYLMKFLTKMRPLFTSLDPSLREQVHFFHDALKETYGAHKMVCASFVGAERPSLLMATRTEQSAVETLNHFMRARLNLVKD